MASRMTTGSSKGPRLSGKLADGGIDWFQIRNLALGRIGAGTREGSGRVHYDGYEIT